MDVRSYNSSVEASENHVATFLAYPLLAGRTVSTSFPASLFPFIVLRLYLQLGEALVAHGKRECARSRIHGRDGSRR